MSKQKTIAIDVDDVLANSTDAFRIVINKLLDINLSPEDYYVEADYTRYYQKVWKHNGIEKKINYADLEPRMTEDQSHVNPHKDADQALQKLAKRYRLIIVTSRPASWRRATEEWLHHYFSDIFDQILFTEEAGVTKGELCREHCASWLIDDNVDHAQSAVDVGIEVILFGDYGWQYKAPPHIHRCRDWKQVLEYFDGRG